MKLKKSYDQHPRARYLSVGIISIVIIVLGSILSFSMFAFTNKNTCLDKPVTAEALLASTMKSGCPDFVITDSNSTKADKENSGVVTVSPLVETQPHEGNADDPAIWIHPTDPAKSLIIGTYKRAGLGVYDLAGNELQFLDQDGGMNNVDLHYEFLLGGEPVDLVVATNWSSDRLKNRDPIVAIYKVNPSTRRLENVMGDPIPASMGEIGICTYRSRATGKYYVFMSGGGGPVEQWELFDNGRGQVNGKLVRSFDIGLRTESCVADDEFAYLYVSKEDEGIWKYGAEPDDGTSHVQVDTTGTGGHLTADVEGLTLYYGSNGTGYLIASCQGSSEYVVYERQGNNDYLTTFRILAGSGIDEVFETDGIDVTSSPLGPTFPQGAFIVHDDINDMGQNNYKLVPWHEIASTVLGQ
jgi:3-phytase